MNYIIKTVPKTDIHKAIALFAVCFDSDSREAELFFEPDEKIVIGAYKGDTLCSMLTAFKCTAVTSDGDGNALYMAGVATSPQHRKQGLFHRCFEYLLSISQGYDFVFCIPATKSLFSLYRDVGMDEDIPIKKVEIIFQPEPKEIIRLGFNDDISEYIAKTDELYTKNGRCYIKKNHSLAESTIKSFLLYGGKAVVGSNFTALYRLEDKKAVVADIITDTETSASITDAVKSFSPFGKADITLPINVKDDFISNANKIIAVEKKLKSFLNITGLYVNVLYNEM